MRSEGPDPESRIPGSLPPPTRNDGYAAKIGNFMTTVSLANAAHSARDQLGARKDPDRVNPTWCRPRCACSRPCRVRSSSRSRLSLYAEVLYKLRNAYRARQIRPPGSGPGCGRLTIVEFVVWVFGSVDTHSVRVEEDC